MYIQNTEMTLINIDPLGLEKPGWCLKTQLYYHELNKKKKKITLEDMNEIIELF